MSVQNVLQGVLSQKVVADDGGGYSVKNDLVNVDTVNAIGVNLASSSTQAGKVTTNALNPVTTFNVANVTSTSIVVVTPKASVGAYYVTTGAGTITITLASASAVDFNYYIAKY